MKTREQQREETRARIVEAALECFAERGFRGASTREIARRAGTNQGLITYHFKSKEKLWREAVDRIFRELRAHLGELAASWPSDPREAVRESIRAYVRFAAVRPELFRLMVEEGKCDGPRLHWLVDTHLKPLYDGVPRIAEVVGERNRAHAYYALAGAGSILFAVAPECRRLTGMDPGADDVVEEHANYVARLLVP